ncbi:MAG: TIGR00159 family protein [Myxococcales bacterium]|nr:MAG: TIGR00159 family protein [Myxococcales bacterium]
MEHLLGVSLENNILRIGLAVLDLLLVWLIVYRILLLIRGTKTVQVLVGLILIIIGFAASKFFGLMTLSWILEYFVNSFIFILIVVFQHDIRRGLSRMGRNPFYHGISTLEEVFFIEELVKAATALSNKRIGALIVIERDADLTDYTEEGTAIDAKVNKELVQSIMHPTSPIHDGAIIIQGSKLAYAGCFLPLSNNPKLSRELGTRHRAGIGISEETDALVIVVSEETGKISFVMDGQITRDLDANTLKKVLQNTLGMINKQRKEKK